MISSTSFCLCHSQERTIHRSFNAMGPAVVQGNLLSQCEQPSVCWRLRLLPRQGPNLSCYPLSHPRFLQQKSTASVGKFDAAIANEPKIKTPGAGKKRQFAPNVAPKNERGDERAKMAKLADQVSTHTAVLVVDRSVAVCATGCSKPPSL